MCVSDPVDVVFADSHVALCVPDGLFSEEVAGRGGGGEDRF